MMIGSPTFNKAYLLWLGGVFRQLSNSFCLTPIGLTSQLELPLLFEGLLSLQILVGSVVISPGNVWIGNEGVFVVTEIRIIGGSSSVLHLLPMKKVGATGSSLTFASSALSSNRPGVRILEARVAVTVVRGVAAVSWPIKPHIWGG